MLSENDVHIGRFGLPVVRRRNLLGRLSENEIMTMAVFSSRVGSLYPAPPNPANPKTVNILHDLVDNLDDLVMWPDGPRRTALDLISKFNRYTVELEGTTVHQVFNSALRGSFGELNHDKANALKMRIREECGGPGAYRG
jgi:hypothetical protein